MSKFKVGDRIKVRNMFGGVEGKNTGTVLSIKEDMIVISEEYNPGTLELSIDGIVFLNEASDTCFDGNYKVSRLHTEATKSLIKKYSYFGPNPKYVELSKTIEAQDE